MSESKDPLDPVLPKPTLQSTGPGRFVPGHRSSENELRNKISAVETKLNEFILELRKPHSASKNVALEAQVSQDNISQHLESNKNPASNHDNQVLADRVDLFQTSYDTSLKSPDDLDPYKKWSTADVQSYPVSFLQPIRKQNAESLIQHQLLKNATGRTARELMEERILTDSPERHRSHHCYSSTD